MNENFKTLNREIEILLEEHRRTEESLEYIDYLLRVYEDKIDNFVTQWKRINPDFANRHFLTLNRRVEELLEDRKKLVLLLGEMNSCLRANEEKIWNTLEKELVPNLKTGQMTCFLNISI